MLEEINFLKLKFFISSYNSYLWNKSVSEYLLKDKNNKNYYFPNIGNLFLPKKDLFILPNIFSVNSYDINEDYKIFKTTTSRNLSVTTTVFPFDIKRDELNKNKYCLRVDFLLPTGCYATMLIRQIFIKLNNYSCREK